MEKTNFEFLSLLKSSLKNEKYDGEKIDFEDLVYIYKMSEIHHVVPMIYNAAYNEDFFKEIMTVLMSKPLFMKQNRFFIFFSIEFVVEVRMR